MTPREQLTPKEIQIASLVWEGLTNREISRIAGTTEQVIKNHLRSTFDKLGVWSRLELAMYVASHGGPCLDRSSPGNGHAGGGGWRSLGLGSVDETRFLQQHHAQKLRIAGEIVAARKLKLCKTFLTAPKD